jgi:anti-sigma-K factor RskA
MSMPEAFHIAEDDLIQYAMGGLKESQLSNLTAHISLCNQCRAELGKTQVALASYAAVLPQSELPSGARERFLSRLNSDTAPASKFVRMRNRSRLYILGKSFQHWLDTPMPLRILSTALAASLIFVIYDDFDHIHEVRKMMPAMKRLEAQSSELAELKDFLHGNDAQEVSLHEKPVINKSPEGHAVYSATSGKLVFTASNMPTPPPGKTYELWILPASGSAPIPAGTFTPDLLGNAAIIFPPLPNHAQAGGFGVTVENEGGSDTPTLPIILSGQ